MNFYHSTHRHYCGIDLHARSLYVCIIDQQGEVLLHKEIKARPEPLLALLEPFRDDLVIGVECMHCWYWISDLCEEHGIHFILGHALYMKAIHGGKTKNDRIDSFKIAMLMKGGKKETARKILWKTFVRLQDGGHDPQEIFYVALDNVRPMMEMRTFKSGPVPFPLNPRRAEGQAMKWIIAAARKRTGVSFDRCLEEAELACTSVADGRVECAFTVTHETANNFGTLHGGFTATLVDVVGTMALLSRDAGRPGVSIEMSQTFCAAAKVGERVTVVGTVLKAGGRLGFTQVEVRRADDAVVAVGRHTKMFV